MRGSLSSGRRCAARDLRKSAHRRRCRAPSDPPRGTPRSCACCGTTPTGQRGRRSRPAAARVRVSLRGDRRWPGLIAGELDGAVVGTE